MLTGEQLEAFSLTSGRKQPSSKQKEQSCEHCNTFSQTMFQSYSHKTVWYCCKNRRKTEEPKLNEHGYSQLVFGKGVKNIHWRKAIFFNKWCWKNKTGYLHIKEWNWIHTSYPIVKWKWIKDLNVRSLDLPLELLRWNMLIYRPRQGSSKKGFRNTRTHSKNP